MSFSNVCISQGTVAACVRCGGNFCTHFVGNSLLFLAVKQVWKSIHGTQCINISVSVCLMQYVLLLLLMFMQIWNDSGVCLHALRWTLSLQSASYLVSIFSFVSTFPNLEYRCWQLFAAKQEVAKVSMEQRLPNFARIFTNQSNLTAPANIQILWAIICCKLHLLIL